MASSATERIGRGGCDKSCAGPAWTRRCSSQARTSPSETVLHPSRLLPSSPLLSMSGGRPAQLTDVRPCWWRSWPAACRRARWATRCLWGAARSRLWACPAGALGIGLAPLAAGDRPHDLAFQHGRGGSVRGLGDSPRLAVLHVLRFCLWVRGTARSPARWPALGASAGPARPPLPGHPARDRPGHPAPGSDIPGHPAPGRPLAAHACRTGRPADRQVLALDLSQPAEGGQAPLRAADGDLIGGFAARLPPLDRGALGQVCHGGLPSGARHQCSSAGLPPEVLGGRCPGLCAGRSIRDLGNVPGGAPH